MRATFLLKSVVTLTCLAGFLGAVAALGRKPLSLGIAAAIVVLWFVAWELDALPALLERYARQRAGKRPGPLNSLWFADLDAEEAGARERQRSDVRHNPTLW